MIEFFTQPWAWYVSGPLLALIMFLLLWIGGNFGVSANLRTVCAIGGAGRHSNFFKFKWKKEIWNLVFIVGAIIGGIFSSVYLQNPDSMLLNASTISDLEALNISFNGGLAPKEIFSWSSLLTLKGLVVLVGGGFMVGFGARWAGGCTSGHAISGLSNLQLPSLIAVAGFFIGGMLMSFLIFPVIFNL